MDVQWGLSAARQLLTRENTNVFLNSRSHEVPPILMKTGLIGNVPLLYELLFSAYVHLLPRTEDASEATRAV